MKEEKLSSAHVRIFLLALSERIVQSKDELNSMDAACGDGDFGSSMYIAFRNVQESMEKEEDQSHDIGTLLTTAGRSILGSAGGASGPIFGTFFIEAGSAAKGKEEVGLPELVEMLDGSMQKVRARGGAGAGDKTLVDAFEPALNSLKEAATMSTPLPLALERVAQAARAGCESTKNLVARRGKARYLGEQTLGFVDPGAYAIALVFATLAKSLGDI